MSGTIESNDNLTGTEVEEHFAFGANWTRFLNTVDEERVAEQYHMALIYRTGIKGLTENLAVRCSGVKALSDNRLIFSCYSCS